ncbi:MAG: penicillin-binding protein 2 [Actinomycetota bacterium]
MGMSFTGNRDKDKSALGIDRVYVRLAIVGTLVIACFVALFSRLWFLQVLASDDYRQLARDNRVRLVHTEPPRGRILDRNGEVLVKNRKSLAVTIDRQIVRSRWQERRVLDRLSRVLDIKVKDLRERLYEVTASPYKPVPVANDVPEKKVYWILERKERFPGVKILRLPIRTYPRGNTAAHILGYVNEISDLDLKLPHFKAVRPRYAAGDLVGVDGLEYAYDRYLRGRPGVTKVVINSTGRIAGEKILRREEVGNDLILALDANIQRLTEKALAAGIKAARGALYQAPAGAAVVMDPTNGQVLGMASLPTFDPSIRADGITEKEFDRLGQATIEDPDDDALVNRTVQSGLPPGSTFKVVTAGAAMATGTIGPYDYLDCPGSRIYPPEGGPGSTVFNNWTSADFGAIGLARSLEISCDTFYYELGWRMEEQWGAARGDGSERFQRYIRQAGFGRETGIDLRYEFDGRVPDKEWCDDYCGYDGQWLPGFTVNMSIGQGDLLVSPLQMAVTYSAIANGGKVMQPRLAMGVATTTADGDEKTLREFKPKVVRRLPLDETELGVIREGLIDVVSGDQGTATTAFAGFPTDRYPIAGKTGTAEVGANKEFNSAWFLSYAPADDPRYVVAVYLEKSGHGGESAAPVARQIYEGIFGIDKKTDVQLGQDASG